MNGAASCSDGGGPPVETDADLIERWLRRRSPARRAVDRAAVERFLAFVGKPLSRVTPADLAAFWETLDDLTPAPRVGVQTAVSSLMTFGRRVGYLPGGRRRRPRPRS